MVDCKGDAVIGTLIVSSGHGNELLYISGSIIRMIK